MGLGFGELVHSNPGPDELCCPQIETMRVGITIQERTCPWCMNRRTGRMGDDLSICFNCRHTWRGVSPLEWRGRAQPTNEALAIFSFAPLEAERLLVYRAAVQSGYFTDWPNQRAA
jgi:hypothetical protein